MRKSAFPAIDAVTQGSGLSTQSSSTGYPIGKINKTLLNAYLKDIEKYQSLS